MTVSIYKIGFLSGLIAFIATIIFLIVQLFQLLGILTYPYDQIWIFGSSLCIGIPFMLEMLALHYATSPDKKFWSHAAIIFTVMYLIFVTANYVVQLATVIPMTLKGAVSDIKILDQKPHSLFWDFDAIGYICMGLATLFAAPIFVNRGFQKKVKYAFLVHASVTPLIAFVYFYPTFSDKLLLLATPWAITAPIAMLLLALLFKGEWKNDNDL